MNEASAAERRAVLDEGNRLKAEARRVEEAEGYRAAAPLRRRRRELFTRYIEMLPEVPVARSPHSGAEVRWPIDVVDLDGWFWNYDAPARRTPKVPAGWRMMNGAMRLAEQITAAPFAASPGPGAPFVVPRILEQPGIVAVISQVEVGAHTGWPITYFGPQPRNTAMENLWGAQSYPVFDDDGRFLGINEKVPRPSEWDFDLLPWLESGKLWWIAPGDSTMTPRGGSDGCPYLGIQGPRGIPYVENGQVRYASVQ